MVPRVRFFQAYVIFPFPTAENMKKLPLLLLFVAPLFLCGQYSTAVQPIRLGGMAFFSKWQTGHLNDNNGNKATFDGYDEVHALLVPEMGMEGLPEGAHSFIVEIRMDGGAAVQVQADLPPLGPQHSAIAIPIFPSADHNVLPELAGAVALLLKTSKSKALQHEFRVRVYEMAGRRSLAEGGFTTEASFVVDRFEAAESVPKLAGVAPPPDSAASDYVRAALARDHGHLRLVRMACLRDWATPEGEGSLQTCFVSYQVQDAGGRCYTGATWLRRKVKKNGKPGGISGTVWPNVREDCG